MNDKLIIKTCPTCGSENIQLIIKDITRDHKGHSYTVPELQFYECPNCGEKIFDRAAIRKIEEYSPAYRRQHELIDA